MDGDNELETKFRTRLTRADLLAKLRESGVNTYTVAKVERIMAQFRTIEEFARASYADYLAAYRKARPESKFDLGRKCDAALQECLRLVREDRLLAKDEHERAEREKEERELRKEELARREQAENPVFSRAEIHALDALMEMCGIESIDLRKITQLFDAMHVRLVETRKEA